MAGLVSPEWLEAHLDDPDVVIVEVSFYLPATAAWFNGHIPGSRYVWWKDFCWADDVRQFPTTEVMASRLGELGVGDDSTLVLVGDPIQFATYAYWVLAMAGFEHLAVVLDGGHLDWESAGRTLTDAPPPAPTPARPAPGRPVTDARVGRDEVLARLDDERRTLVDLRSAEEYEGQRVAPLTAPFDHGAERKGHIPGARHLPHERLLTPEGRFLDGSGILAAFAGVGVGDDGEVVTYCRLSHRASLAWFALTRLAGRDHVRVYDGSWTEWGSMVGMPIERTSEVSSRNH
jgi:thiosulfate/3-mercaptopyruvate sulfurtransferase